MKLFVFLITLAGVISSCAQTRIPLTKSYGFLRQNSRGTIPVDDNNNPLVSGPDSQYVVYIELPTNISPLFTKAWVGHQTFDVFATKAISPIAVGAKHDSNETIELSAQSGSSFWQLNLQKGVQETVPQKYAFSATANNILVKGKWGNNSVYFLVDGITPLEPIMYP